MTTWRFYRIDDDLYRLQGTQAEVWVDTGWMSNTFAAWGTTRLEFLDRHLANGATIREVTEEQARMAQHGEVAS
jgi:hypothetical protein